MGLPTCKIGQICVGFVQTGAQKINCGGHGEHGGRARELALLRKMARTVICQNCTRTLHRLEIQRRLTPQKWDGDGAPSLPWGTKRAAARGWRSGCAATAGFEFFARAAGAGVVATGFGEFAFEGEFELRSRRLIGRGRPGLAFWRNHIIARCRCEKNHIIGGFT